MKTKEFSCLILGLLIMLASAAVLHRVQGSQKLGEPGVRVVSQNLTNEVGKVVATNAVYLPDYISGHSTEFPPLSHTELEGLPSDTTFGKRVYMSRSNGLGAMLNVVLMGGDRTSIHSPYYCMTGTGWQIEKAEVVTLEIPAKAGVSKFQANRLVMTKLARDANGRESKVSGVFYFWFQALNESTYNRLDWMWRITRDMFKTGTLTRWAYFICFVPCAPGAESLADAEARDVIAKAVPDSLVYR